MGEEGFPESGNPLEEDPRCHPLEVGPMGLLALVDPPDPSIELGYSE